MSKKSKVDNPEIIAFALFDLGGVGAFVDIEEVFFRAYEIAPERFGWHSKPIANYKSLSKALRDFEGSHPGLMMKTADGLARQLTAEGVDWINSNMVRYRFVLTVPGANPPTRRPSQRILNEIQQHPMLRRLLDGAEDVEISRYEAADMLLCTPDSRPAVWRERLETYQSAAADSDRRDIVRLLDRLLEMHPVWFGGEARGE